MEPTLQVGDRIIVNKLSVTFGTSISAIVVFKAAGRELRGVVTDLVKRVIGLPGDTDVQGQHDYVNARSSTRTGPTPSARPAIVTYRAEDHYFMMGDNTRTPVIVECGGTVPRSDIIGKAFVRSGTFRIGFI